MRKFYFVVAIILASMLSGCMTIYTVNHPSADCSCTAKRHTPRFVYSGLRCDFDSLDTSCDIPAGAPVAIIDMPFSFVGDTVILPVRLIQAAAHHDK